jgi:hypothetical protein
LRFHPAFERFDPGSLRSAVIAGHLRTAVVKGVRGSMGVHDITVM